MERVRPTRQHFERFYERTIDTVFGYFVRRTAGDRQLAEDLTQETYLAAARTFPDQLRSETAWIIAIARRRLIDHIRRSQSQPRVVGGFDPPEPLEWPQDWDADELAVFAALARLPPDQRNPLLLHYVDGLSVGEVASLMNRSRTAVYSLLARGRRSLRAQLEEVRP